MDTLVPEQVIGPIPVPDDHHFARYVKNRLIVPACGDSPAMVDAGAFTPRSADDGSGVSGNHAEYFGGEDLITNMRALRAHLRDIVKMNIKSNGGFGVAITRNIVAVGRNFDRRLEVIKDPMPAINDHGADNSHALIVGVEMDDLLLDAALGREMTVFYVRTL